MAETFWLVFELYYVVVRYIVLNFSNIYFGTKCLKKLEKKSFELYQLFVC